MAIIKTIPRGQSLTIAYLFPETYDMARIITLETVVGQTVREHTTEGRTVYVRLTSEETQQMFGQQAVTLMLEDTMLGVQKPYSGQVNIGQSYSKYSSEATSALVNIVVPIVITETIITADDILYDYFRCKSAYELAVDGGYTGTEEEFNEDLAMFRHWSEQAEAAKQAAEAAALLTAADALATAADRVQTGLDAEATAADRVQTGLDVIATGQAVVDSEAARDKAAQWAENPEDVPVETDPENKYSALHWAAKAEGHSDKAELWANEDEDVEVEPGKYSAKHFAEKAADVLADKEDKSNKKTTLADNSDTFYPSQKAVKTAVDLKENAANKQNNLNPDGTGGKYSTVDTINANARKYVPLLTYNNRVVLDSGVVHNLEHAHREYVALLQLLNLSMVQGWSGVGGYKLNGNNASKLYDMTANNADMSQATAGSQPFVGGRIAPNESAYLKFVTGQTGTTIGLTGTAINFASGASWTIEMGIKTNKLSGRIYLSASDYILITSTAISLVSAGGTTLTAPYVSRVGLIKHMEFQYANGAGLIKVNNVPLATTTTSQATVFGSLYCNQTSFNFDGEIHYLYILNQRISEAASDALFKHIRSRLSTIQGVAIGNQFWASSNFEGVVAGDGTVIPEVQSSIDGANVVVNGTFDSSAGWTISGESQITGGVGRVYSSAGAYTSLQQNSLMTIGKIYKLTYDITASNNQPISITDVTNAVIISSTVGNGKVHYFKATETALFLKRINNAAATDVSFDNVILQELGWASSTDAYNGVIAQGGTVYQALQAAAMWSYYNNDAANGVIYGKLYNWYAVALINLFPPNGYSVATEAQWQQLRNYIQELSSRIRTVGTSHWSPNTAFPSTNETGASYIGAGFRSETGAVTEIRYSSRHYMGGATSRAISLFQHTDGFLTGTFDARHGLSLRLIRTEPVGDNERQVTVTTAANIASTPVQIPIPFGYIAEAIRIENLQAAANLTSISATHNNTAGTSLGTLITGKTVNATISTIFPCALLDMPTQATDGTIRVLATGNAGAGCRITVIMRKQALSTI